MSYTFLMEDCENCTCSPGQAAAYSAECFSDIPASVLSKLNLTAEKSCCNASETESCPSSQSGMTCGHSTENRGKERLIASAVDFRASHFPQLHEGELQQLTSGLKCPESLVKLNQDLCSQKMLRENPLSSQPKICELWDTLPEQSRLPRLTWVLTTYGQDIGYLHTPTTKANYNANSMQKWPSCRNFRAVFGSPSPITQEWMMGWPIGWTDLSPLEMAKYQVWLDSHGIR